MGYDGESRRVWVQDGVGRREYTYDAWGRVRRQQGCCGSEPGIDVVAVAAEYDAAGRKRYEKELDANDNPTRTIETTYDKLGRLQTIGDYRGQVVYHYDNATGRLQREAYPNGSSVEYTYYGSNTPSQVGFVWKVEHRKQDGSLLIGYEYTYDLLGRVVQSVERRPDNPTGDTTVYTYTPSGRLGSEARTGQVAFERQYAYNPDGSRRSVYRNDLLNGEHREFYAYDPVSGRLSVVEDRVNPEPPYPRHEFVWNPEGTLARWWNSEPNSYARVFSYDEEGRLTKIERDYGNGNLQTAYEYGYTGDGVRVWKRDVLNQQEYRYSCRIGCGGVPMRVCNQAIGNASWASVEDYLPAGDALGYGTRWQVELDMHAVMTAGFGESLQVAIAYQDSFGVDLSPQMTPCMEQVVAPAIDQPCPPLGSGDGCEEVEQQLVFVALSPCTPSTLPRWFGIGRMPMLRFHLVRHRQDRERVLRPSASDVRDVVDKRVELWWLAKFFLMGTCGVCAKGSVPKRNGRNVTRNVRKQDLDALRGVPLRLGVKMANWGLPYWVVCVKKGHPLSFGANWSLTGCSEE